MSIDESSTLALWMAVMSIAALVLVGRRKPARATRRLPRGDDTPPAVTFDETPSVLHHRPGPLRRLAAVFGLSVTAVVVGALAAIALTVSVAVLVITLSDLLG